jgi:hypothetical protein
MDVDREGGEIEGTDFDFVRFRKWRRWLGGEVGECYPPVINAAAIEAPNRIDRHEGAMLETCKRRAREGTVAWEGLHMRPV